MCYLCMELLLCCRGFLGLYSVCCLTTCCPSARQPRTGERRTHAAPTPALRDCPRLCPASRPWPCLYEPPPPPPPPLPWQDIVAEPGYYSGNALVHLAGVIVLSRFHQRQLPEAARGLALLSSNGIDRTHLVDGGNRQFEFM